jgi:hypothetical protein
MERMQLGDLDPQLAHPDDLFRRVVRERDAQVAGKPQVIRLAGLHPGSEGVPFSWSLPWRPALTSAPFRDFPQQPHLAGRCRTLSSGWSVSGIVAPGWPFGRPGFLPDFPRNDFGDGFARPSDDGGFEEFRDLRLKPGKLLPQHRDLCVLHAGAFVVFCTAML